MNIFRKKDDEKTCSCGGKCNLEAIQEVEKRESGIKILGSGCAKCITLEKATNCAIEELGLKLEVQHITDFTQIASYGVMSTPALVVNGSVVSYGKVLSVQEVKEILSRKLL